MVDDRTGWAIAGTGNIARRFAEDLRHSKKGHVVAVASADTERGRRFAAAIGPQVAHGDLDNILARADVQAVYVAGRNELHCEHAMRSIAAGKPVLVEKPFATSAAEAERITDAARGAGILAMEAMWMRFIPAIRALRTRVEKGEIGAIRRVEAGISFINPKPLAPVIADLGVYPLSLAVNLLGTPESVSASATADGRQVAITLRYENALAILNCGFDAEGGNSATVVGTKGVLSTDAPLFAPSALTLRPTKAIHAPMTEGNLAPHPRLPWRDAARSLVRPLRVAVRPLLYRGNGLHYEADHFTDCLRAGLRESPLMPLTESVEVMRIVERVESLVSHRS
ncbi:Gfo/Idh/MocA family protein [Aureimonas psammosilenae]|uniref:Gfo/Idh/MocA family protein n=1 Tax=Aureimonas psammosilenae TaxID=2495496 RepID=UPI001260C884|nr:Gfo/Idh/MocA family oxidoreductase [Aureimonas psammosilenae]